MEWKVKIESAVTGYLPGNDSHKRMLPPGRSLHFQAEKRNTVKKSCIMVLLFQQGAEILTCLIKRPAHMKYHPGQIGFPGGMVESTDNSLIDTALRETWEELGIEKGSIKILGTLSELYISVSSFLIYPIIGWYDIKPDFRLNPFEVEKLILFPLIQNQNRNDTAIVETSTGQLVVPCFRYEDEIIWGATAMILAELFDVIKRINDD